MFIDDACVETGAVIHRRRALSGDPQPRGQLNTSLSDWEEPVHKGSKKWHL